MVAGSTGTILRVVFAVIAVAIIVGTIVWAYRRKKAGKTPHYSTIIVLSIVAIVFLVLAGVI